MAVAVAVGRGEGVSLRCHSLRRRQQHPAGKQRRRSRHQARMSSSSTRPCEKGRRRRRRRRHWCWAFHIGEGGRRGGGGRAALTATTTGLPAGASDPLRVVTHDRPPRAAGRRRPPAGDVDTDTRPAGTRTSSMDSGPKKGERKGQGRGFLRTAPTVGPCGVGDSHPLRNSAAADDQRGKSGQRHRAGAALLSPTQKNNGPGTSSHKKSWARGAGRGPRPPATEAPHRRGARGAPKAPRATLLRLQALNPQRRCPPCVPRAFTSPSPQHVDAPQAAREVGAPPPPLRYSPRPVAA